MKKEQSTKRKIGGEVVEVYHFESLFGACFYATAPFFSFFCFSQFYLFLVFCLYEEFFFFFLGEGSLPCYIIAVFNGLLC